MPPDAKGGGLHAFRHGLASTLAENGASVRAAPQLGQGDAQTRLGAHACAPPGYQREALDRTPEPLDQSEAQARANRLQAN